MVFRSIRDEDVEFGDALALKKMRRGPKYAWSDVEHHTGKDKKQHPIKETSFVGQEAEDARMWANLQYNDMRDYSRLKSALQLMEQKTNADGRHRDINAKGPGGHTPLMMAVMQTSAAVMRGSLESKEEPMPEGAVANACVSIKDLLGMKADVNAKNDRGKGYIKFPASSVLQCLCLLRPDNITHSNCLLYQRGCPTARRSR